MSHVQGAQSAIEELFRSHGPLKAHIPAHPATKLPKGYGFYSVECVKLTC
jgi:hypothetical protein